MGFIIYYLVLILNPMGRVLVRWKRFKNKCRDSVPSYLQSAVWIISWCCETTCMHYHLMHNINFTTVKHHVYLIKGFVKKHVYIIKWCWWWFFLKTLFTTLCTHIHTHMHTLSPSLSLSLSHTHTHNTHTHTHTHTCICTHTQIPTHSQMIFGLFDTHTHTHMRTLSLSHTHTHTHTQHTHNTHTHTCICTHTQIPTHGQMIFGLFDDALATFWHI